MRERKTAGYMFKHARYQANLPAQGLPIGFALDTAAAVAATPTPWHFIMPPGAGVEQANRPIRVARSLPIDQGLAGLWLRGSGNFSAPCCPAVKGRSLCLLHRWLS